MSNRVEITAVLDLPTPIRVTVKMAGGDMEKEVISAEWVATAYVVNGVVSVRTRVLGRGHYSVWCSFSEENAPSWVPALPEGLRGAATAILKEMMA